MNSELWNSIATSFRPVLRRLVERLSERETEVKLEQSLIEKTGKALKGASEYEFLKTEEENFQVGVLVGFSGNWHDFFAGSEYASEAGAMEKPGILFSDFAGFLKDSVSSSIQEGGIELSFQPFTHLEGDKKNPLPGFPACFATTWSIQPYGVAPEGEELRLMVLASFPDPEVTEKYTESLSQLFDQRFAKVAVRAVDRLKIPSEKPQSADWTDRKIDAVTDKAVKRSSGAPGGTNGGYRGSESYRSAGEYGKHSGNGSGTGKTVEFEPFDKHNGADALTEGRNINLLRDVEMDVSVELGRKRIPLGKILQLAKGSVVELDKLAGEPVNILVNGRIIALGDVVVIDEHFGVRITKLLAAHESIKADF